MARRKAYYRTEIQEKSHAIERVNNQKKRALARVALITGEQVAQFESHIGEVRQLKGRYRFFTFEGSRIQCYPQPDSEGELQDELLPDLYTIDRVIRDEKEPLVELSPRPNPSGITYSARLDDLQEALDEDIRATEDRYHPTMDDIDIWAVHRERPLGMPHD